METLFYNIITFGCQMNVHESEKAAAILESKGYIFTERVEDADIAIVNTCTIRKTAENRALGNLGYFKKLKQAKSSLITVLFGCLPQEGKKAEHIKKNYPYLDIIFGTHNLNKLSSYIDMAKMGKKVLEIEKEGTELEGLESKKRVNKISAFVNIMVGCNNFCSYCIVPFVRGREKSRDMAKIKDEVKSLVKEGYKEITLLGQNVNSYKGQNNESFARLLQELDTIEGEYIIRFLTSHPKDLTRQLVDIIAFSKHIAHSFHLPVQSGSNKILKEMNRKYTIEQYLDIVLYIKEKLPLSTITTDIIAGFPGEEEEDFQSSMQLLDKIRFNSLFSFVFSPREGTKAYQLEQTVKKGDAKRRLLALQNRQKEILEELAKEQIGKELVVLCESFNKKTNLYMGRSKEGRLVSFSSSRPSIGKFVRVKIKKSKNSNIIGVEI